MDKPSPQVKPRADALRLTSAHQRNHTSQCGEDGIIAAIFDHLKMETGVAVEFGAWDGALHSNTNALVERGWKVILIEGKPDRFETLQSTMGGLQNVTAINAWVAPTGENSLDAILARAGISECDFLAIDIDGNDYHVLAALAAGPKVICVEFNPTIPPPICFVGGLGKAEGSSLVAFDDLMSSKGYVLVHATKWNAFFVRGGLADLFVATTPAESFIYRSARFVVSFFDGRNQIVDVLGKPAKAKNQWSKARAAIALNLPSLKLMALGAALLLGLGIALSW